MMTLGIGLGLNRHRGNLWTPAHDPALAAWYRRENFLNSTNPGDVAEYGETLRQAFDVSGNGLHLDQTVSNQQPVMDYLNGADWSNGLAAVCGPNIFVKRAGVAFNQLKSGGTLLVVLRVDSYRADFSNDVGVWWNNGTAKHVFRLRGQAADPYGPEIGLRRIEGASVQLYNTPPFPTGQIMVWISAADHVQGRVRIMRDGVLMVDSAGLSSGLTGTALSHLVMGGETIAASAFRVGEFAFFDRPLSEAEMLKATRYCQRKFNL